MFLRYRTILRSGAAFWLAPVALALPLLFYMANASQFLGAVLGWAPATVSGVEQMTSPFSYAVAAGLGVWEAGRLREAGIWRLAPVRSRYRIAAEILLPVVCLTWLSHLVVIAYACVQTGVTPDPSSARTLVIPLVLCPGWAVIGFAVGCRVWRLIAAPLLAIATWILTAMAWSLAVAWPRMLSGVYPRRLQFGEIATIGSLVPHLVCAGCVAGGLALLWMRGPRPLRIGLAVAVALAGPLSAYAMVRGDGFNPPLVVGQAPMTCAGSMPRVCMPAVESDDLPAAHAQTVSVLTELNTLGVAVHPRVVTDDLQPTAGTSATVLSVPLTVAVDHHSVRFAVMMAAVRLPCLRPDLDSALEVRLWAAERTGFKSEYLSDLRTQLEMSPQQGADEITKVSAAVDRIRALSAKRQADWYRKTAVEACEGAR